MAALRLFLFSLLVAVVASQGPNPVVRVTSGLLQGSWQVSTNGRNYASFEGVPYARPPVGKYRFREPQNMKPWTGTWDATKVLSPCLQYDPFLKSVTGSENCLFLNIYTPRMNAGANLPVMVYIHGGAFMYGAGGMYGAENLMDRDMVVVTVNYRVGPLGFLSTGDEQAPGNFGLKDQSFALRWVQQNIMMFGGNPDSVTLTGCSAGGASVHYHYLSPLSKGTFIRGIAFSGSAFMSWAHAVKPVQKAKTLAGIVGCPSTTTREMVDCLKYRPAEMLVNAQIEMFDWKVHMFTPFTPTVEAPGVREPFLSQYPYHAAQAGAMHRVPLITSITTEEGLYSAAAYQADPTILPDLESHWEQLASNIFEYNDTLPLHLRPAVAAKIKQKYLGGKPVSQETYAQLVQALGDRLFGSEVGRLAHTHALRSGQPMYVYRFAHRGSTSLSQLMSGTDNNYGVSHADDVLQIFKFPGIDFAQTADKKMIEGLLDMVYSYVSTGVPKFPNGPVWQPVTPGAPELNYLEISSPDKAAMKASSDFGHRSFWDSLGFIENEKYQVYVKDEL
ncbi:venom carboxylesterase-6-like isoform X2 [Ostrinia furnacalis]|uniref:venom carboxylesterase-6-like isoform X2 n=1 Tax=Ostrinia furnacalis TaxID=93504 RepID=UPI00103E6DC6|nr:venom carboxylesterase-6-like isoform X2 [Ostrinia furnacalis]